MLRIRTTGSSKINHAVYNLSSILYHSFNAAISSSPSNIKMKHNISIVT